MKSIYCIAVGVLLLMVGCLNLESDCTEYRNMPTSVEILVTDLNGKPLPNQLVRGYSYSTKKVYQETDANGFVKTNFIWADACGSPEYWSITAEEKNNMASTNCVYSPAGYTPKDNVSVTVKDTIRMDSFAIIPLRLKCARTDIIRYELAVFTAGLNLNKISGSTEPIKKGTNQPVYHDFGKYTITTSTTPLDTVVYFKAFKNFAFKIDATLYSKTNTAVFPSTILHHNTFERRDTVLMNVY
jgi:hypothetical protein